MAKTRFLNQDQAQAVYSAMCALNNVGGNLRAVFDGVIVQERADGSIFITKMRGPDENFKSQWDFAAAYGLEA